MILSRSLTHPDPGRSGADRAAESVLVSERYQLLDRLGIGTTASVWRARDLRDQVDVAIKIMMPGLVLHAAARTRFEREADLLSRLAHPHLVKVRGHGIHMGQPYIVMDLVRGGTLAERIHTRGPMEPRLLAALMHQVLLGLHHVHDQGMVHRDMKPHNVLIDSAGRAILSDFGLARAFDDVQFLTRPSVTMGTMGYIAPEQEIDARRVDHRTDLYGAGATLFMCLTGKEPEVLHRASRDDAQLALLPGPLADVVFKSTRLQPDERYQTAVEMADALGMAMEQLPVALGAEATPIADTRGMNSSEVLGRRLKFDALAPKRMVVGGGGARERALAHNLRIAAEKRRTLGLLVAAVVLMVAALFAWFALRPAA